MVGGPGEAPGILNWALVGLARLKQQNAFHAIETMRRGDGGIQVDSNPAANFLTDYVEFESGAKLDSKKIYEWYVFGRSRPVIIRSAQLRSEKRFIGNFHLSKRTKQKFNFENLENSYFGLRFSVSEILGEKISENQRAY